MHALRVGRNPSRLFLLATTSLLLAADCGKDPKAPPVAPSLTGQLSPGKVIWHDLAATDPAKVAQFYTGLLGWTFRDLTGKGTYLLAEERGTPVAGILKYKDLSKGSPQWVTFFSVSNVDTAVAKTVAKGGKVLLEARNVPDRGRLAILADPQGATVGVLTSTGGDPADNIGAVNRWLWREYFTHDLPAAQAFYNDLFGYESSAMAERGGNYVLFRRDTRPRAGAIKAPMKEIRPNWLPTIRVDDVQAAVAKVPQLGGRVIMPPRPDVRNGTVAIVADPNDAAFALQQWAGADTP